MIVYDVNLTLTLPGALSVTSGMNAIAHAVEALYSPEGKQQVRALIAKGALSPGVMATSDCKGDHATLAERGVEFIQEPAERPYGIEALLRDDSGNWFSFCQRKFMEQKA